eukprot:c39535_g1_i1.p1 GENE.c39535_g1_i1~~c39535_g1_i1.p1  ORF type:complete len:272 (-),score=42.48 c39535_g1_i1:60-845(-)
MERSVLGAILSTSSHSEELRDRLLSILKAKMESTPNSLEPSIPPEHPPIDEMADLELQSQKRARFDELPFLGPSLSRESSNMSSMSRDSIAEDMDTLDFPLFYQPDILPPFEGIEFNEPQPPPLSPSPPVESPKLPPPQEVVQSAHSRSRKPQSRPNQRSYRCFQCSRSFKTLSRLGKHAAWHDINPEAQKSLPWQLEDAFNTNLDFFAMPSFTRESADSFDPADEYLMIVCDCGQSFDNHIDLDIHRSTNSCVFQLTNLT